MQLAFRTLDLKEPAGTELVGFPREIHVELPRQEGSRRRRGSHGRRPDPWSTDVLINAVLNPKAVKRRVGTESEHVFGTTVVSWSDDEDRDDLDEHDDEIDE